MVEVQRADSRMMRHFRDSEIMTLHRLQKMSLEISVFQKTISFGINGNAKSKNYVIRTNSVSIDSIFQNIKDIYIFN